MAFGMRKLATRRADLSGLPDDWVACLEPGVEVEGNLKVASGSIRLNTHIKGDIVSEVTWWSTTRGKSKEISKPE